MLYLDNTTDPQTVLIPREVDARAAVLDLELRSTVTQRVYPLNVTSARDGHHYWAVRFSLPEGMEDGEYEYTARVGVNAVASGLAVVGDYSDEKTIYNKAITYEQYTTE